MKKLLFALIALLGIMACEENQTPVVQQILKLSVDNTEIYADGTQTATFTVKDDKDAIVKDATINFADTNEALESNTFKTKFAGVYTFYAKKGDAKSNEIVVTVKEVVEDSKVLSLTVEPTTIAADGVSVATFEVTCNNEKVEAAIYNAADNSVLEGNTFSTEEAGTYTFYAKYEELTSNDVTVTAEAVTPEEEKPISLETSTDTIKANGVDSAQFIVKQDGVNVTGQSTIYVNGGKMSGSKFSTTTDGVYTVYATKGNQKSNEITITAEAVEGGSSIVFAEGVTLTSGWYDCNKKGDGTINGDINNCWAASSANIIEWWQDRYVAAGNTLPAGAVTGPGVQYELAVYEIFYNNWDTSRGGHTSHGVTWYFEGRNIMESAQSGSNAQPKDGYEGGYFKEVWDDVLANTYHEYNYLGLYNNMIIGHINNYYEWGNGTSLLGKERLQKVTEMIVEFIARGPVGMIVAMSPDLGTTHHGVTLWGYEIDNATGLLTRIWITDDGDQNKDPKTPRLNEYTVDIADGKSHPHFKCDDVWYKESWLVGMYPCSGYGSINK